MASGKALAGAPGGWRWGQGWEDELALQMLPVKVGGWVPGLPRLIKVG